MKVALAVKNFAYYNCSKSLYINGRVLEIEKTEEKFKNIAIGDQLNFKLSFTSVGRVERSKILGLLRTETVLISFLEKENKKPSNKDLYIIESFESYFLFKECEQSVDSS